MYIFLETCQDMPELSAVNEDHQEDTVSDESTWSGFKLVGDNLDKNVHPRYGRIDHRTQSLHFFQLYAVKDRVNLMRIPTQASVRY